MSDSAKSIYFVDAHSDPVLIRIEGRASFQNSACLHDFVDEMLRQGKARFVIDFQRCTSMDSTFQGVLAGAAIALRKKTPPGSLVLARMGPRNLELIRNVGLHRLSTVDSGDLPMAFTAPSVALPCPDRSELENARLVLEAHENLISVDENNRGKFQDVLAFLKNRTEQS
ncbi:MAG TPA: STAS domain-containing protein [Opitutaceae bacterium]|jgi:anti-anti-sigma regulatory factor|nr:STAS domain-containing protein [Opitutaceae bacterium]